MNKLAHTVKNAVWSFAKDEEGSQIVEYSLLIAVVSIVLVIALAALAKGHGNPFGAFISRVTECLTTSVCY